MSVANLDRISAEFSARIEGADRIDDPVSYLSDLVTALARDIAETVFFKVHTEAGWTDDEAQRLACRVLEQHALGLTDVVQANGGTLDLTLRLTDTAADAYGARLAELSAGYGYWGVA